MSINVAIERITPKMAQEWLDLNHEKNRRVGNRGTEFLTKEIGEGRWVVNGDAIRFGFDGKLIDGQHRLRACVAAGKAIKSVVVTGLDPNCISTIDQGKRRSLSDLLAMSGYPYKNNLASALNVILNFDHEKGVLGNQKLSYDLAMDYFFDNKELLESVKFIEELKMSRIVPSSISIAAHHMCSDVSTDMADDFFTKLALGTCTSRKEPVHVLREKLIAMAVSDNRIPRQQILRLICKAWNLTRKGKKVSRLFTTENDTYKLV